ncbi:MAG: hypothetical protein K0R82_2096 [Flavipsychrobacter sp.]|nr:hypothetical protein [Flavipsychrobacter sp.]
MRKMLLAAIAATIMSPICDAQTLWRQTGYSIQDHNGIEFSPAADSMNYYYGGNHASLPTWDPVKSLLFSVSEERFLHDSSVHYTYNQAAPVPWYRDKVEKQTIDAKSNVTNRTRTISQNGGVSFMNYEQDDYTYDASGNLTLYKYWWWVNNQWKNTIRETYTYNVGNLAVKLAEVVNSGTGQWENSFKRTYSYTGGKLSEEVFELWQMGTWILKNRTLYSYDANGRLSDKIFQVWDATYLVWENKDRRAYGYDVAGNLAGDTAQIWLFSSSTWRDDDRFIYEYDANNNPTSAEWQGYSIMQPGWIKFQKNNYFYNADTLLSHYERMYWNNTGSIWEYTTNSERYNYFYQSFTFTPPIVTVPGMDKAENNVVLFPNPAITQLRINATWKNAQPFTVAILDMSGRVLRQWSETATKTYSSTLPVMDMPAGNYTLLMNNGEEKISGRFSVLK